MRRILICVMLAGLTLFACLEDPKPYSMRVSGAVDDHVTAGKISGAVVHLSAGYMREEYDLFGGDTYMAFHSIASAEGKSKSDGRFDVTVSAGDEFALARITVKAPGYQSYATGITKTDHEIIAVALEPVPTP